MVLTHNQMLSPACLTRLYFSFNLNLIVRVSHTFTTFHLLAQHSYAFLYKGTLLYYSITSIYVELFIILTWYQSNCSNLKVFHAVLVFSGILPLPQPSPVLLCRCHQNFCVPLSLKVDPSPKTHCLQWDFRFKALIETPPLDRSPADLFIRTNIAVI